MSGEADQPAADDASSGEGGPWPSKETNSVTGAEADSENYAGRVHERVLEFEERYPDLAETPLSETHGRKLRRIVTEAEWTEEHVEPETPSESAFTVSSVAFREAVTWSDAVSAFLTAHTEYKGLLARFANDDGEEFDQFHGDRGCVDHTGAPRSRNITLSGATCPGDPPRRTASATERDRERYRGGPRALPRRTASAT